MQADHTPPATPGRLFVFGLGYTALALARDLLAEGWTVAGTCRGEDKCAALAAEGIAAFVFDRDRPLDDCVAALAGTTHLLASVPPDAAGDLVIDRHGDDLQRLAPTALTRLGWIGYLSTTGVYGDCGGAWVDEEAPLQPTSPRAAARVAAERDWLELGRGLGAGVQIFRLAGIYGPGRGALEAVRAGEARRIVKPGQVFGRIHVDDIVAVLRASLARPRAGALYNGCDDEPAPPQDVIAFACALLGVPAPPEEDYAHVSATLSAMARSFYADNKRVSNQRLKEELGVELRYPDYRAGLRALATEG